MLFFYNETKRDHIIAIRILWLLYLFIQLLENAKKAGLIYLVDYKADTPLT
jgi:hypothetical protein